MTKILSSFFTDSWFLVAGMLPDTWETLVHWMNGWSLLDLPLLPRFCLPFLLSIFWLSSIHFISRSKPKFISALPYIRFFSSTAQKNPIKLGVVSFASKLRICLSLRTKIRNLRYSYTSSSPGKGEQRGGSKCRNGVWVIFGTVHKMWSYMSCLIFPSFSFCNYKLRMIIKSSASNGCFNDMKTDFTNVKCRMLESPVKYHLS